MAVTDSSARSLARRLRRAFGQQHDAELIARALARGLVDDEAVARARAVAARDGRPLASILADAGALSGAALAQLEREVAAEDFARPAGGAPVPAEVEAALGEPARQVDGFVLIEPIGSGASAEVWRAWDRVLGRWVALKLAAVAVAGSDARERFAREAHAAARLDHPNIAPVYAVGARGERPYLVMPFIAGETLDRLVAREPLPERRALEIAAAIADAVHHAHERRIVHRDLKPGNVMIAPAAGAAGAPDGRVFVLDFGLAFLREAALPRLTRPGEVVGTAAFMAPEQAHGGAASAREAVDVYGLGATLYFLTTGRPPFVGDTTAAVTAQVLTRDPVAPRRLRPDLGAGVEALILAAMDKDPARRPASAAAFGDEVRRLLAGQPGSTRVRSRARRWLRRRARVLAAAACGALAALGAMAWARWRIAAEGQMAARALGDIARVSLDTALRLRRAGDLAGMREVLPRVAAAYQRVLSRGADTAELEYMMGRMYRALLDPERALEHQQRALALDPGDLAARYERAVLFSERYGRTLALTRASRLPEGEGAPPDSPAPELAGMRALILADADRLAATSLGETRSLAARGILAYHRGLHDESRRLLEAALARDPEMEEAWATLALAEEAAHRPERALEVYAEALRHDRGYVPFHVGRCELRRWVAPEHALEDAAAALALDPASVDAHACRGGFLLLTGHRALMAGRDPAADLAQAERDLSLVIAARDSGLARHTRAAAHRYRGMMLARAGIDPGSAYAAAAEDATRGAALEPWNYQHLASRARTHTRRAEWLWQQGGDPAPAAAAAEADLVAAEALAGGAAAPVVWLADLRTLRAGMTDARDERCRGLAAAEHDFTRAAPQLARLDGFFLTQRGRMWRLAAACGADPGATWARAATDLEAAMRALPDDEEPALERVRLALARARSGDAEVAYAAGLVDHLTARAPATAEILLLRARVRRLAGDRTGAAQDVARARALRPGLRRLMDVEP